jgi:hypothetical protein
MVKNNSPVKVGYVGVDCWGRPVFKDGKGNYYGSTDILFSDDASKEDVLSRVSGEDLLYFGKSFGCEPYGSEANVVIDTE